ncbi:dynein axonemal assembly factor 4-like isoform X1 [Neodiprion fabricii]|uniref:dynein axonemal assembly factor 4-like isoform X1 n=1 Tax=Neodiprion fabricii TaxID=2872261 RepID=UPI001ED9765F|nr:dynein axonemal assembly factor 4-like isoform X1 [Neodiprion fabricii]
MPAIVVKEYSWRQTDDSVVVSTPLFGNPKNVDLFTSTNYIKASYPPFVLELFLWGNILEHESKCILDKEQANVVFTLKKADLGLIWPSLLEDLDKHAKKERRTQALEQAQVMAEERAKARSEKRHKLQKQAVRAQINLDTATLNKIDLLRDTERKQAMNDFEEWRCTMQNPILSSIEGEVQENRKAYRPPLKWFKDEAGELKSREMTQKEILNQGLTLKMENSPALKQLEQARVEQSDINDTSLNESRIEEIKHHESNVAHFTGGSSTALQDVQKSNESDSSSSSEVSESDCTTGETSSFSTTQSFIKEMNEKRLKKFYSERAEKSPKPGKQIIKNVLTQKNFKANTIFDEPKKAIPLPRQNGIINVKFSERTFPTPARESHQVEEQEWLEKQAAARRQTGFILEDLRPEELDPQWLKDKGDEFFKAGNYLGAISAYSHGIKLSPKMSSLYSNRSAAHYALGNYFRCTEDCSKALELMVPHCKGNLDSRAKCHARRGAALCKLSSPQHGIPELEAALKLDPENATIKRDLLAAKQYFDIHKQ